MAVDQHLTKQVSDVFFSVPEVQQVQFAARGPLLFVWVATESFEEAVLDKILEMEIEIFRAHPAVQFDFHVIPYPTEGGGRKYFSDADVVHDRKGRFVLEAVALAG